MKRSFKLLSTVILMITSIVYSANFVVPARAAGTVSVCDEAHFVTALSGGGNITFSCSGTITLTSQKTISADTIIDGTGQSITIQGDGTFNGFYVNTNKTATFQYVTLTNFKPAIVNSGTTNVISSTLTANSSSNSSGGGAILNYTGDTLNITSSTFSNNSTSSHDGGAIFNWGILQVTDSTFTGNTVTSGGGGAIASDNANPYTASATVINSTFASNSASLGGAVSNGRYANTTVINSTFYGNSASLGGGALYYWGTPNVLTVKNSIIAGSPSGGNCSSTKPIDGGNNLEWGVGAASTTCGFSTTSADPMLGSLGLFGGATQTIPLQIGSPAIDAGNDTVCADAATVNNLDQRGVARPQNSHCDIGAYEYDKPFVTSIVRASSNPTSASSVDFTVTFNKSVTGVDQNDFTVTSTGAVSGASVSNSIGSGAAYTVTVSTGSNDGTIRLDLNGSATGIMDSSSNAIESGFTNGETYTIDRTAPTVTAFTPTTPANSINIPISSFTASDANGATGYLITESATAPLSTDGGWSASAPTTYAVASGGVYSLYPWAKDGAGNISPVATPVTVTVDLLTPTLSITSHPVNPTTNTSASFAFSGTDRVATGIAFYQCKLDSAAFTACTSPKNYSALSASSHTFQVRAIDYAGNVSNPASFTWTIQKERTLNGGFNTYAGTSKIPTNWTAVKFSGTDGKNTTSKKEGAASVQITGTAATVKTLTQTLPLSGASGSKFTFSFWAKGSAIPAAGLCKADVLIYSGATLKLTKTINCSTGTYAAFAKKSLTFTTTSSYTKVVMKFTYSKASGTIWFDSVSLIK